MKYAALCLIALCLYGCTGQEGRPLRYSRTAGPVFYVERHEADGRDLASKIAKAIRQRGLAATSGAAEDAPEEVDFLVTYEDRWSWDMRMYLLRLRIDIRDPVTRESRAYGQSYQDSIAAMGKTHWHIVQRAMSQIFPPSP